MFKIPILLTIQSLAATITLVGVAVIVSVVLFLLFSAGAEDTQGTAKKKVYKQRRRYFWGLIVLATVMLFYSFKFMPYNPKAQIDEVVTVIAYQWSWRMAPGISKATPDKFKGKNEITLPANKNIKFIVTARDVNHNFAVYNSEGDIVTQTQATPGYKNELVYNFKEKGEYTVLCLEYCGMTHAFMIAKIHIN